MYENKHNNLSPVVQSDERIEDRTATSDGGVKITTGSPADEPTGRYSPSSVRSSDAYNDDGKDIEDVTPQGVSACSEAGPDTGKLTDAEWTEVTKLWEEVEITEFEKQQNLKKGRFPTNEDRLVFEAMLYKHHKKVSFSQFPVKRQVGNNWVSNKKKILRMQTHWVWKQVFEQWIHKALKERDELVEQVIAWIRENPDAVVALKKKIFP